jgi:serine/threonine protein kinase
MDEIRCSATVCSVCKSSIPHESAGICPVCMLRAIETAETNSVEPVRATAETGPSIYGPYLPIGVLGEGGMGIVYLAEQTKPIRRRVALKVMKHMAVGSLTLRFESERQHLALLDHPNIAKLYEAGKTVSAGLKQQRFRRFCSRLS